MRSYIEIQRKKFPWVKGILVCVIVLVVISMIIPLVILHHKSLACDWLTAFMTFYLAMTTVALAITTALVIIWQGQQLKKQLELQVTTDLYREWNSGPMFKNRRELCSLLSSGGTVTDKSNPALDKVEGVIEFFERIASYYMNGVLTRGLIWDTFSFYIMRYYFYTHDVISNIEQRWGDDRTLYSDLTNLYNDLIEEESIRRGISKDIIEQGFKIQTERFKKSESL
jgi:hypothetical protein